MKLLIPILLCFLSLSALSQEQVGMPGAIKIPKKPLKVYSDAGKPLYTWRELIISDTIARKLLSNIILERLQDATLTAYISPYNKTQQEQATTTKLLALAKKDSNSVNRLLFYEVWTFNSTLQRMEVETISVAPAYQSDNSLHPLSGLVIPS